MAVRGVPALALVHYNLGKALALWGWSAGAAQAFRDALRRDPAFTDAQFRLGETLGRAGRWLEASAAFREAVRLTPSSPEMQGHLVMALGRAGLWNEAALALRRLIDLRPRTAELHILHAAIQRKLRCPVEVIRSFRWALRLELAPRWSRFNLGEALLGTDGWEGVLALYKDADLLAAAPPARAAAGAAKGSALNRRPESLVERRVRGARLRDAGVVLLSLLAAARTAAAPPRDSTAALQQARQCIDLPKERGIAACRAALALGLGPRRAAVIRDALAGKLAALRRWEEVVAVYREAARVQPESAGASFRLGTALLHAAGRPDEALPWLREAARLDPADPRPWGALGAALSALGRNPEAAAAFEEAVRRDPAWLESRPASRAIAEAARRGEAWP